MQGNLEEAREYQAKSVKFIDILIRYGRGVIGGKLIMKFVGLDCGSLRAPAHNCHGKKNQKLCKRQDTRKY